MSGERRSTCVVVRVEVVTAEGEQRTRFYGPFLPHVGSATTSFVAKIESQHEDWGSRSVETFIEDVFIDPAESDCVVEATR